MLLFQQLGLPWGAAATWAYILMSLLLVVGLEMRDRRLSSSQSPISHLQSRTRLDSADLALAGVTLAALLVRLYAVRDLRVGPLGDSYHHTLMAQLVVENRGIFHSWQPYAPLATFTYHFGFHANAAFVHYVGGLDVVQSVIWSGQILNAIVVPLAFALALALGASRWAGVWAALIAGFVSNLPAFFVNWGRYTQLTGQIVLVVVVVCWVALAETTDDGRRTTDDGRRTTDDGRAMNDQIAVNKRWWSVVGGRWSGQPWRLIVLTAFVTAAMMLTHYLVGVLAAAFVASYLLTLVLARRSWHVAGRLALRAGLAGGLALLLAAPWLLNVLRGHLLRNAAGMVGGGSGRAVIAQLSALEPVVPKYAGGYVLLGALLGLLVACWRRDWRMALPAVWCALLVLIVVPYVVGLPGAGVVDTLTGLGTLYLPTALLAGYALAAAQSWGGALLGRLRAPGAIGSALVGALLLAVVALNAGWQARIVGGETALVVDADLAAIAWIRENTPPEARFLVNSFPAYGGTLAAGSDAGWWLPLLAGRWASLPPLTYGSEQGEQPSYQRGVNALVMKLRGHPLSDAAPVSVDLTRPVALKALADNRFDYVYSGVHPYPGPAAADRFDTARLRASPLFRLVYDRDGVEIFQILKSNL